ncbi:MAG: peptidase S24 [Cyanobium sp. CACIAM 14]|nr:MAG: peptidase S24 [Cyanobium sp. CACIAM 14]
MVALPPPSPPRPSPPSSPRPPREDAAPLFCLLATEAVSAGFPSPADDYVETRIDLNIELVPRPLSTFFMRVSGDAMRGDGIVDGDLLVIDRSVDPRPGMVVVAVHDGGFLLRRLIRRGAALWLAASDGASPPLALAGDERAELWGVVIHAVHHLAGAPSRRH